MRPKRALSLVNVTLADPRGHKLLDGITLDIACGSRTAILASDRRPSSGLALKIEDGDGYERATWAATVEALSQAGVLEGPSLRELARYRRPASLDPHGRVAAEAIAEFELVPVGELIG